MWNGLIVQHCRNLSNSNKHLYKAWNYPLWICKPVAFPWLWCKLRELWRKWTTIKHMQSASKINKGSLHHIGCNDVDHLQVGGFSMISWGALSLSLFHILLTMTWLNSNRFTWSSFTYWSLIMKIVLPHVWAFQSFHRQAGNFKYLN